MCCRIPTPALPPVRPRYKGRKRKANEKKKTTKTCTAYVRPVTVNPAMNE